MRWEADPLGSGLTVARFEVRHGDDADQFGGNRAELWGEHDLVSGMDAWFTWSWLLGDGRRGDLFRRPSSWALGMQNHGGTGSPPQAVEFSPNGDQFLTIRQIAPNNEVERIYFGDGLHLGERQYYVLHVKFKTDRTGLVEFWHSAGNPPQASDYPRAVRQNVITLYSGAGFPKIGLYRDPGLATTYPWVYYLYGYRRCATRAEALSKWSL